MRGILLSYFILYLHFIHVTTSSHKSAGSFTFPLVEQSNKEVLKNDIEPANLESGIGDINTEPNQFSLIVRPQDDRSNIKLWEAMERMEGWQSQVNVVLQKIVDKLDEKDNKDRTYPSEVNTDLETTSWAPGNKASSGSENRDSPLNLHSSPTNPTLVSMTLPGTLNYDLNSSLGQLISSMIPNFDFPTIHWAPLVLIFLGISVVFIGYQVWGTVILKKIKHTAYIVTLIAALSLIIGILGQLIWNYSCRVIRGYWMSS